MPKPLEPMWTDEELRQFDREWQHLGWAINAFLALALAGFVAALFNG